MFTLLCPWQEAVGVGTLINCEDLRALFPYFSLTLFGKGEGGDEGDGGLLESSDFPMFFNFTGKWGKIEFLGKFWRSLMGVM